uniref:Family with sequence similarity 166 member A n=1 Tax=Apteryx owenii TaxID=8824 RepID=A0A8B9PPB7_APTOW
MAAARKSSLFPPDPRYIPGYEGFVPQYGFQFGETFGKTTFRLLTDPNVRKSPHSLLAPLHKLRFIEDFSGTKREVPDYIPAHPGEQKAGFHPFSKVGGSVTEVTTLLRSREVHGQPGRSPGEQCSGSELSCGVKGGSRFYWCLLYFCFYFEPVKIEGATLPAVAEPVDAESCNRLPRLDVPNTIQQKAISGYTGYIPRYTWITGVGYIQGVKDAMSEFDRNQFLLRNPVCEFGKRLPQTYWPNNRIYTSAGLIPFYTGFVPSNYALTFGNSTRKAYQKEQRRQACALRKKL